MILYVILQKIKAHCALMMMLGTPDALVNLNTIRAVPVPMNKAKAPHAEANIKNVVRNAPDMIIPPAISLPDISKTAVVPAAAE